MYPFSIVTDSACDLSPEWIREMALTVMPLRVTVDGTRTVKDDPLCPALSTRELYALMRDKHTVQTAAPAPGDYLAIFEPIAKSGRDILLIGFSSGLSGTFASAKLAAEMLTERYPETKIAAVDSLCASLGLGLLLDHASSLRREGWSLEQTAQAAETLKHRICHWFTVDDLTYLRRGGRISSSAALVGSLLNIKPVMHMNAQGKLESVSKVKGRKNAIRALAKHLASSAISPETQRVYICHGDCPDDAQALADEILSLCPVKEVRIHPIGPAIGAHSGPGTLAVFFVGTGR